jgi:hypothetical protein
MTRMRMKRRMRRMMTRRKSVVARFNIFFTHLIVVTFPSSVHSLATLLR